MALIGPIAALAVTVAHADCPQPLAVAVAAGEAPADPARCGFVDLELAGRAWLGLPDVGLSRGLSLPRAHGAFGVRMGDVQGRFAVDTVRSGGDAGYIGIDGEALAPVVEIAEVRWDWRRVGLALAGGQIDDPWAAAVEAAWGRPDVLASLPTASGFMDRADTGGWASWTAPGGVLSATLAATTGEGGLRRERNEGTNVTGVVHVRPLARAVDAPIVVDVAVFARDGSRGLGQAPDHRAGAAVFVAHPWVAGGVDGLLGWGFAGDGTGRPAGVSLWARSGEASPVMAFARVDRRTDRRDVPGSGVTVTLVGAGPRLPLGDDGPAYLVVGWQGTTYAPAARPIAGADALAGTDVFFVQLGAALDASVGF